jgi:hypothetical protein
MRHNAEIAYAQQEKYCPVKLFKFENEHINKKKYKRLHSASNDLGLELVV